jgi:ankyrin repeat protein
MLPLSPLSGFPSPGPTEDMHGADLSPHGSPLTLTSQSTPFNFHHESEAAHSALPTDPLSVRPLGFPPQSPPKVVDTCVSESAQEHLGAEFDRLLTKVEASRYKLTQPGVLEDITKDHVKLYANLAQFFLNLPPTLRSAQRQQALAQAINKPDSSGSTLLHLAVRDHEVSANEVKWLLVGGANIAAQCSENGRTPLEELIRNGHADKWAPFREAGVDPNTEIESYSLLFWAMNDHRTEMVEALLKTGANPNVASQSYNARTPLQDIALKSHYSFYKDIAELLVKHRADVNLRGRGRDTPLHLACKGGNTSLARLLLDYGARTDYHNGKKQTPLEVARTARHPECAELLEKYERTRNTKQTETVAPPEKRTRLDEIAAGAHHRETSSSSSNETVSTVATAGRPLVAGASTSMFEEIPRPPQPTGFAPWPASSQLKPQQLPTQIAALEQWARDAQRFQAAMRHQNFNAIQKFDQFVQGQPLRMQQALRPAADERPSLSRTSVSSSPSVMDFPSDAANSLRNDRFALRRPVPLQHELAGESHVDSFAENHARRDEYGSYTPTSRGIAAALFNATAQDGQPLFPTNLASAQKAFLQGGYAHRDVLGDLTPRSREISKVLYDAENTHTSPSPDAPPVA